MYPLYALLCLLPSGFTLDFLFHDRYYIIATYILLYHLYSIPPVSCSYIIIPWVFCAWYRLQSLLLLYDCAHDMIFNACLWFSLSIHVCLSLHATWPYHRHSPGSSDSPRSSCPGLRAWSLWILPVADLRGAAVAWIIGRPSRAPSFQAPCHALEFSCYDSKPPFVLFILEYLFVFSQLRISVM